MFSAIISVFNELLIGASNGLKKNFFNYNELETAMDNYTLVSNNGSLLSIIKIDGIRNIISGKTYYEMIFKLSNSLSTNFDKKGHVLQSCFHYNPVNSEDLIEEMLKPSHETCDRLNLDLHYMLDAQKEVSKKSASEEKNFLLIWTNVSCLSKEDMKKSNKRKVDEFKDANLPIGNAANPFIANEEIFDKHRALLSSLEDELNNIGIVSRRMQVQECVREIRMGIDEEYTGENWTPFLPGDRLLPTQLKQYANAEEWDVMAPKLSQQICNKDAFITRRNVVKVGNVYYAPIYVDLMPKDITFFYEFFKKMISYNIGWRMLYTISGDGMASVTSKHLISQILSFTSSSNKLFNASANYLKRLKMDNQTIVKFQIALCTWADTEEKALEQVSQLARKLESWGSMNVSEVTGNPIAGLASASMGFTQSGIATVSAAPITDAFTMLPLSRPSSLWDSGGIILKSPDGKLLPYQPMSTLQDTWNTLIFAGPGSGKSVFTNMTHIALCTSAGIERLPRISIIDIGFSSKGFIDLMIDALPTSQKHYALYTRIANTDEYCMNPFDTKVGGRFPFAVDRQYMINLVSLIMTDPNAETKIPGLNDFISAVIDEAFKYYCDSPSFSKSQPKPYTRGTNYEVDNTLTKINANILLQNSRANYNYEDEDEDEFSSATYTSWWQIVDMLAEAGFWHEAMLAQRYAVPVLTDLTSIANLQNIQDLYGKLTIGSETITEVFVRMISSTITNFPLLSGFTKYDLGEARIISLDLDQVAKKGSKQADLQTSIMYMYAIKLTSGDFFLDIKNVDEVPMPDKYKLNDYTPINEYKNYHSDRINKIKEDKKRLSIDEFHRANSPEVSQQVQIYMREGRKWNTEIILASQSIIDFSDPLIELATTIFILSAGKNMVIDNIVKKVGIDDEAEIGILKSGLRGPSGGNGNIFMAKFVTKRGGFTQLLNNKMGPIQIWSLSTTVDDVKVREIIFEKVGSNIGRKILADAYPNGSAASEIEERKKRAVDYNDGNIHMQFANDIIRKFGSKYGISMMKERM